MRIYENPLKVLDIPCFDMVHQKIEKVRYKRLYFMEDYLLYSVNFDAMEPPPDDDGNPDEGLPRIKVKNCWDTFRHRDHIGGADVVLTIYNQWKVTITCPTLIDVALFFDNKNDAYTLRDMIFEWKYYFDNFKKTYSNEKDSNSHDIGSYTTGSSI